MSRQLFRKIGIYLKGYRGFLALSLVMAFISALLSLCIPFLTGRAVDCILGPGRVDLKGAVRVMILIFLCAIFTSLSQYIMSILNNKIACGVVRDMRDAAFAKIGKLPLSYLDNHPYGDILSRVISDADQFSDGLIMGFSQFFTGIVTIFGTLIFMLLIDLKMGLIVMLLTPLSFFVARSIAVRTYRYALAQSRVRGKETAFINEMVGGAMVIKAFNREEKVIKDFDDINEELRDASLKATFFSSLTNPSTRFVNNTVYAVVAIAGGLGVLKGLMTVGELTSFLGYAREYTKPFNEITGVVTELQNALACAERLLSFIDEEEEEGDSEDASVLSGCKGEIVIDNASFSYTKDRKLIRDFSLRVKPGQHIAIAGPTGCGKTTLINLLMRFYDVNKGSISVDGTDIRKVTKRSLRDSFGMVLQDTWLKSGTIRDNLTMGNTSVSEEEMMAAARDCHAHSFIMKLPQGYDTFISGDGGSLSAGQKQLLCITRAMLSKPSMLILDEATSSIDTRTEIKIQEAFHRIMEGKTGFIVAHRLSTIREADVILVMKDGNIIEQGSHEDLLERKGFYHELYQSQFAGNAT